jgi:hypothetical protein
LKFSRIVERASQLIRQTDEELEMLNFARIYDVRNPNINCSHKIQS